MHRLILGALFLAACSTLDYRAAWCERFCAGVSSQTCSQECPLGLDAGALDAGVLDAGPLDAGDGDGGPSDAGEDDGGQADAGEADAGGPDAGLPDAGDLVVGPFIEFPDRLGVGGCSNLQLGIRDADGGLVAGVVSISVGAGVLASGSDSNCTDPNRTAKTDINTLPNQKVPLYLQSSVAGPVKVTVSSSGIIRTFDLVFRARINATCDNLDAGCTVWHARLVSILAENQSVSAGGEQLTALSVKMWPGASCSGVTTTTIAFPPDGSVTFALKQGTSAELTSAPYIDPVELIAATPTALDNTTCSTPAECLTHSCSATRCACLEVGAPSTSAVFCCSQNETGRICN